MEKTWMKPGKGSLCLGVCLVLTVFGAVGVRAQEPIIINEVLADPASDWDGDGAVNYKSDEWIEVLNVSVDTVDLATYWVRDATGTDPHMQLYGLIGPGEAAVFYGSEAMAWQAANGVSTTGLSLNNGGDVVQLLRSIPGGSGLELMYSVHYEAHMAVDDRSNGWNVDRNDWQLFDALLPYNGSLLPAGNGCGPTPGLPNVCGISVPTEASSFGTVKSLFR